MNEPLIRECMNPEDSFCRRGCAVGTVCVLFAAKAKEAPYPFCSQPWKCAGTGSCQRGHCCAD
jgi:hypothetical protein